ncbi:hypothetical protein ACS0TY_024229 [Phlomoides rotata]
MIQVYYMCTIFAYVKWQARTLLKSLFIIDALSGLILGYIGTSVPRLFPKIFSPDPEVIQEVSHHTLSLPSLLYSYESNKY